MNWNDGFIRSDWLDWARLLLTVLILAVLGSLLTVAGTMTTAFGPFNPF